MKNIILASLLFLCPLTINAMSIQDDIKYMEECAKLAQVRKFKGNPNFKSKFNISNQTPLMEAAAFYNKHSDPTIALQHLIAMRADVNMQDNQGFTALDKAILLQTMSDTLLKIGINDYDRALQPTRKIRFLLTAGANPLIRNNENGTCALQNAQELHDPQLRKEIENAARKFSAKL